MSAIDQMWTSAADDVAAEQESARLAVAQVRCATIWPRLAVAASLEEYAQRRALSAEAILDAAEGDPVLAERLAAGLDADFRTLHASRAPERDAALARQVRAALVAAPAPGVRVAAKATAQQGRAAVAESPRELRDRLSREASAGTRRYASGEHWDDDDFHPADRRVLDDAHELGYEHARAGQPRSPELPNDRVHEQGYHEGYDEGAADLEHDRRLDRQAAADPPARAGEDVPAEDPEPDPDLLSVGAPRQATLATCRKCTAGRTPDKQACGYCLGQGALDATTAMVQAADGWDQGLVQMTAQGAVVFDPAGFGSERYQHLPPIPQPTWTNDWAAPVVPGANPISNPANGRELADTRSFTRDRRAGALRATANPYAQENPYMTQGPGTPGPDMTPGAMLPGAQEVPLASGGAQPIVQDGEMPHPVDDPAERTRAQAARAAERSFSRPASSVAERLAARVIAANAGIDPAVARLVAEDALRRFPAVGG